jgi:spore germination protein KB
MTATAERISTLQLLSLVVVSRLSLTLIYFGVVPAVRQDTWWGNVPDTLLTMMAAWGLSLLWRRFPDKSLVLVIRAVLGRFMGPPVAALYVLVLLLWLCLTLRLVGEVLITVSLPGTPVMILVAILALLAAYSVRAGLEVLGRSAEIICPILLTSLVLIFLLLLPGTHFERLLPLEILTTGPVPHLQSMVGVAARTIELVAVSMMVPSVTEKRGLLRAVLIALTWIGFGWILISVSIFGVLGGNIQALPFPWLTAIRSVHISDFFDRIDGVVLALWILGMFIRVSLLLWAAAVGAAQTVGLRRHRALVLPLASLATLYAMAQARSLPELLDYMRAEIFTPFMLTFLVVIPAGLLAVSWVRSRISGGHPPQNSSKTPLQ